MHSTAAAAVLVAAAAAPPPSTQCPLPALPLPRALCHPVHPQALLELGSDGFLARYLAGGRTRQEVAALANLVAVNG